MIKIVFPDGTEREYNAGITAGEVARDISSSLYKKSVACRVGDTLKDLSSALMIDSSLEIITIDTDEGRNVIRHTCAHILAEAVKQLYPNTQVVIGPVIKDGFYYDFLREEPFSEKDLLDIEVKMSEIMKTKKVLTREVWSRNEAVEFFKSIGEVFKAEIISSIPEGDELSIYKQGEFLDLCKGPHVPNVSFSKHFKLLKVSGSYWRGDSSSTKLQRIYGTAWGTEKELSDHLFFLEEVGKRDHRRLGTDLELFHISDSAVGSIFWHEKGWSVFRALQDYIRNKLEENDYIEVRTPQLLSVELWKKSGHWDKYREHMFVLNSEKESLAVKPMNCPAHIEIFNQGIKSHKQLPIRMAEFGSCHRNEPSGALHGLMRVRNFTQDDAHIFCKEDQIESETLKFCELLTSVYKDFGFSNVFIKFSDRPEKRAGSDETWDRSEDALKSAIEIGNYKYALNKGEGAFYGPKLEFVLKDAIGREWQCGTLQVDFILPERLNANYINEAGNKEMCVVLHRAILGSFERFIGILTEEYCGKFPLWLAPKHVAICTVTNKSDEYAESVNESLRRAGVSCILDIDPTKINSKIKKFSLQKIPYIIIIGQKEEENKLITIRAIADSQSTEESGENVTMTVDEFIGKFNALFSSKAIAYTL